MNHFRGMTHIAKCVVMIFFILLNEVIVIGQTRLPTEFLIIRNINVVDVLSGNIIPNQDVVINDSTIFFIGDFYSKKIPTNAIILNGTGKYLCPGLWDMHFHLCWNNGNDTLLHGILLKLGIVAIRDMGGDLNIMRSFKDKLRDRAVHGPMIIGAGPIIDGNPPVSADFTIPVDDNTDISRVLDSLKESRVDFFKTYSLIKKNQLEKISKYCIKHNFSFSGHLSEYIEPEVSINFGQKSVEHLDRLYDIWITDKKRIDNIGHSMVVNKSFLCPTLITYYLKSRVFDTTIVRREYNKYILASLMEDWKRAWNKRIQRSYQTQNTNLLNEKFIHQKELVRHLNSIGVKILAGSDFAGMPYVYPGVGLHQELRLLVDAGLSNLEALRTATINPAEFFSLENKHGSLTVGKYANVMILNKNPLEIIDNISSINIVVSYGTIIQQDLR